MAFRIGVLLVTTLAGYFIGYHEKSSIWGLDSSIVYSIIAFLVAGLFIWLEILAHEANGRKIFISAIGLLIGMAVGSFLGDLSTSIFTGLSPSFKYVFVLLLAYIGFTLCWLKEEDIKFGFFGHVDLEGEGTKLTTAKILDTSVIIDGRIADIAETGFLEGDLIVPKFVLNELHQVADSSDPLKRSRGRRGLDILNNMKASKKAIIKITEKDFTETPEVDTKLLKLGHHLKAAVVTNDYNLNKVAEFQDVQILNINDLSNAVKPVVLPNEELRITVIKEGKDQNQGIAYLDDGTMVVIDNGRHYIGQDVKVTVTSILQTPAGRMIFTQLSDGRYR